MAKVSVKASSKLHSLAGAKTPPKMPTLGKPSRSPSLSRKDYGKKKKTADDFGNISFGQTGLTGQS